MRIRIGFTGLLTITFIFLQLTHAIDWSWLWVLSPLWISFVICVVLGLIVLATGNAANKQAQQYRSNQVLADIRARRLADERKRAGQSESRPHYFDQTNRVR